MREFLLWSCDMCQSKVSNGFALNQQNTHMNVCIKEVCHKGADIRKYILLDGTISRLTEFQKAERATNAHVLFRDFR